MSAAAPASLYRCHKMLDESKATQSKISKTEKGEKLFKFVFPAPETRSQSCVENEYEIETLRQRVLV